jgi:hypothetical protein
VWQWALGLAVGVSGARACRGGLVRLLTVGELRGLSDDEARTWLLAHGSQGFALRRVCYDQGPSQYQFLRSPFVQAGQEQDIDSASTPALEPVAVPAAEHPSGPIAQPNPTQVTSQPTNPPPTHVPFYYHPADITIDSEHAPVPVFRSPQRRVRLKLNSPSPEDIASNRNQDKTPIKTLLLHEAVAYPNRIQNRSPLVANQPQTIAVDPEAHSFLPGCIDFAYGTDKPGGMVIHTVTPLFTSQLADPTISSTLPPAAGGHALGAWGQGPLTEFLMRDPLHYQPPMNLAIEVRSCRFSKNTQKDFYRADLVFDDVLGTVNRHAGSLFTPKDSPDPSPDPPFTFNPQSILILSRVGDQLFVIDQDSDFIPCDETKLIYILYHQNDKDFLSGRAQSPNGSSYSFKLNGLQLDEPVMPASLAGDTLCLSVFRLAIDASPDSNVNNLAIAWEVKQTTSQDDGDTWFYSYFNEDPLKVQTQIKSLPIRVMPTLANPKVAVVLQKHNVDTSQPKVRKEATELFGSVSSSRLSFSAPTSDEPQKLCIYSQQHVSWELRDADWLINCNDREKTSVIVVKYLPDGGAFAAFKTVEMPTANPWPRLFALM